MSEFGMDLMTAAYAAAGLALPMFYLPQIRLCLSDTSGLRAFSFAKSASQLALRAAMLPFVLNVGNELMSFIALLDFGARALELAAALYGLRRQVAGCPR